MFYEHDTDINSALINSFQSGSEISFIYKTAASALLESLQKKTELLRIFLNVSGNLTFAEKKFQYFTSISLFFYSTVSLGSIHLLLFSSS